MPKEIKLIILGNLDHKNLCTMQALSREWHIVASEDSLWQDLFSNKYPTEPLPTNGQAQKKFRAIMTPLPLKDKEHLHNAITTFFCNLKWNKKREFICSFPNEPSFSLKAAQSFGPERGTEAEFERPTDETEYYQFTGLISPGVLTDRHFGYTEFIRCPGKRFHSDSSPLEETGIPFAFSYSFSTNLDPVYGSRRLDIGDNFVNGSIEGVNIAFGDTLGYFSSINGWRFPFELFCISEPNTGKPVWVGLIPRKGEFKFVSINSQGIVTWEKREGNRILSPRPRYDRSGHGALRESLHDYPIKFS